MTSFRIKEWTEEMSLNFTIADHDYHLANVKNILQALFETFTHWLSILK